MVQFQSTHPTRGCDCLAWCARKSLTCFNPRTPRGGATIVPDHFHPLLECFNPRTPRGGATGRYHRHSQGKRRFNPRTPRGGATSRMASNIAPPVVSIHAPHEGVRHEPSSNSCNAFFVSIHAPHEGVRHVGANIGKCRQKFQSTHPTRGCDDGGDYRWRCIIRFNPRTPRGGATLLFLKKAWLLEVSIHAPHEGVRHG